MTAKTGEIFYDGIYDAAFLHTFSNIWAGHFTTLSAAELLASAFPDPESIAFRHKVDEKVMRVLDLITHEPSKNISNENLAEAVGLSEVQLRRVFKNAVGVPIRRYRLWHRLFVAMRLLAGGQTLTSAALDSGFSDSSHFNHVFRDAFGVNPSTVLKKNGVLRVFVSQEFSKDEGATKRRQNTNGVSASSRKLVQSHSVA
ncbi:MAG TPA: AraC family transcriptional regulator [Pseudomonadales bacterium]|nr:AraC family transcriptional regulator [Pseudomonadales bacterium]